MPLYYFDVREDVRFVPDDEGMELPDLDAAETEAAEAAALITRDAIRKRTARSVTVEVRDDEGQRVITVVVALAIDRVSPTPTRKSA